MVVGGNGGSQKIQWYFNIAQGQLARRTKNKDEEGAVTRINQNNREVTEVFAPALEGRITDLKQ